MEIVLIELNECFVCLNTLPSELDLVSDLNMLFEGVEVVVFVDASAHQIL